MRTDPTTQAYLARKHAQGKTKAEAIRCLKRHLARHIWRILYAATPPTPSTIPNSLTIHAAAPSLMPCTR